ncbi:hypothetical protein [Tellurirhabdus bombi]|uniref:hypothetical protein n=1 Tax=Tellurirhabdus bombi TaxID=2907205 RepID=UPI001F4497DB|nr:hypothetical protein [Tellurirhabdus bombi]
MTKKFTSINFHPFFPWLVISLLIVAFYYLLITYSQNIPAADDFHATLQFLLDYEYRSAYPYAKIDLLLAQHNEHRIAISRLLALFLFKLTGHIDLPIMLYIQQFFLLGLAVLLLLIFQKKLFGLSAWIYVLPVVLLFNPASYDSYLMIAGGSQSYPALFFMVLALFLLDKASETLVPWPWLGLAVLAASLATYSFGCGLTVWIGGGFLLFYQRCWKSLAVWSAAAVLFIGLYFFNYSRPITSESPLLLLVEHPFMLIKCLLVYPGTPFLVSLSAPWMTKLLVCVCFGIGVVSWIYVAYLFFTGCGRRSPLLFSLLVTSLCVGAMLALSRSNHGLSGMFTSRYRIISSLTPICMFAILVEQQIIWRRQQIRWFNAALLVLFAGAIWIYRPYLETQFLGRNQGFIAWKKHGSPTLQIQPELQQNVSATLSQCIRLGIYQPPVLDSLATR